MNKTGSELPSSVLNTVADSAETAEEIGVESSSEERLTVVKDDIPTYEGGIGGARRLHRPL